MVRKESNEKLTAKISRPTIAVAAAFVLIPLLATTAILYFLAAAEELPAVGEEQAAMLESILFVGSGIGYAAIVGWITIDVRRRKYNKLPYTLAIAGSALLIGLYVASRSLTLPVVGLQTDVGTLDVASKVLQGLVIAVSSYIVLRVSRVERSTHVHA